MVATESPNYDVQNVSRILVWNNNNKHLLRVY